MNQQYSLEIKYFSMVFLWYVPLPTHSQNYVVVNGYVDVEFLIIFIQMCDAVGTIVHITMNRLSEIPLTPALSRTSNNKNRCVSPFKGTFSSFFLKLTIKACCIEYKSSTNATYLFSTVIRGRQLLLLYFLPKCQKSAYMYGRMLHLRLAWSLQSMDANLFYRASKQFFAFMECKQYVTIDNFRRINRFFSCPSSYTFNCSVSSQFMIIVGPK